jgi:integrase/recombinase XerD
MQSITEISKNRYDEFIPKESKGYLDNFIENCEALNRSPHTLINYRTDLEKFLIWLHHEQNLKAKNMTGDITTQYQDFLKNGGQIYKKIGQIERVKFWIFRFLKRTQISQGQLLIEQPALSVGSRRRHLSTLKNFFEYLKQVHEDKQKIFRINPVKSKLHNITLKDQDVTNTVVLKDHQYKILEESIWRFDDRYMMMLLYYAGLRLEEISRLKFENFNPEDKSITFIRKGGSRHTLYPENADKIFEGIGILKEKSESSFLFTNNLGKPLNKKTLYNRIMKAFKRAGLPADLSPHSFRKGCATRLYLKTRDLLFVRDYLNHADAKVTQTYIDKGALHDDYLINYQEH